MPFQAVPNVVMAEVIGLMDGQVWENTLYFWKSVALTSGERATLALNLATWWDVNMQPLVNTSTTLERIKITDLSSQFAGVTEHIVSPVLTGTLTGNKLPNNVAICVKFLTPNRGRSYRGRNYVGGLTDNAVSINTVITSYATSLKTAYEKLFDPAVITVGLWSVVSRWSLKVLRPTGIATTINAVFVNLKSDSMRTRLPERGR